MNKKILIFGKGFIGERLAEELNCPVASRRIGKFSDAVSLIRKYRPKVIINCIGHTGKKNVDGCELALDKTLFANSYVPLLLAEVCLRNNIKLVHISSGCIYDFNYKHPAPITEENLPDYYKLYYSRSKIYAENALLGLSKRYNILIARIRIPLDDRPHSRNILNKLISYKKIIDVPNSVTYIPDFVRALKHLLRIDAKGIFNVTNAGGLYYDQLLDTYRKYRPAFQYKVIRLNDLNLVRTNLILSTRKLERTGFKVRHIKDVLEECVRNYTRS